MSISEQPGSADGVLLAVDLFCGAGGLTVGLQAAGFSVIAGVDVHPLATRAYRDNHPDVRVWEEDVRRIDPAQFRTSLALARGELDLLAACPPCQGFSSMRTLNGGRRVRDARRALVHQIIRFVEELGPRAVMVENVPGLADDWRSARLRRELRELGYGVAEDVVNVADFGVPQRRRRYVMVALKDGQPSLARPDGTMMTVRQFIGDLPEAGGSGDPLHDHGESRRADIRALIARIPPDGGSRSDLGPDMQLACHRRTDGFYDVYGRMHWDRHAPTITGGCINPSKGRFLHPQENRAITLREAALLQTFPPTYRLPLNDGRGSGKYAVAELIGNALPPAFVTRQAAPIAEVLRAVTA